MPTRDRAGNPGTLHKFQVRYTLRRNQETHPNGQWLELIMFPYIETTLRLEFSKTIITILQARPNYAHSIGPERLTVNEL
jgi:hypothetical protein